MQEHEYKARDKTVQKMSRDGLREENLRNKEEKGSLKEDLKDLGRNKPWWILLCAGIMALVFNSLRDGSAVFYFKYYVDSSDTFSFSFMNSAITLITIYLVLGQAANILGIMFVPSLTKRIGKNENLIL